jgi:hypothetical protein
MQQLKRQGSILSGPHSRPSRAAQWIFRIGFDNNPAPQINKIMKVGIFSTPFTIPTMDRVIAHNPSGKPAAKVIICINLYFPVMP